MVTLEIEVLSGVPSSWIANTAVEQVCSRNSIADRSMSGICRFKAVVRTSEHFVLLNAGAFVSMGRLPGDLDKRQ